MTALVFGASAGLGRALARRLAASGRNLVLLARDARDLEAEAANLRMNYGVTVSCFAVDASSPSAVEQALAPLAAIGQVTDLLFPIGLGDDVDIGSLGAKRTVELLNANFTSIVVTTALFMPSMAQHGKGSIVGFGSVAAIRGRGSNIVYAAAKRGLESYFESLRHLLSGSGLKTQFYRLGYLDTQMSFGRKMPFPIASPVKLAEYVYRNLGRDIGRVHYPKFWMGVGLVLQILPWGLYRRLRF